MASLEPSGRPSDAAGAGGPAAGRPRGGFSSAISSCSWSARSAGPGVVPSSSHQQRAQLVVGQQRLGDVAARAQDLHQRGARRLAERRGLDRLAGGGLGGGSSRAADADADRGDRLEQPRRAGRRARGGARRSSAASRPGSSPPSAIASGLLRGVPGARASRPPGSPRAPRASPPADLPVDPGVLGQRQRQLAAALEPRGADRLAQPRQRRGQQRVAGRGRPSSDQSASISSSRRTGRSRCSTR